MAFHSKYDVKRVRAYSDMYDDAVRLMRSEDLKAFNLNLEDQKVRDEYGTDGFGQGCLLARRLIENDVRHVEVTLGGWDTHNNNFQAVQGLAGRLDQGLSALLNDLDRRGLLSETLVVLTTEFGRTPYVNENDGRDHFPKAFSGLRVARPMGRRTSMRPMWWRARCLRRTSMRRLPMVWACRLMKRFTARRSGRSRWRTRGSR